MPSYNKVKASIRIVLPEYCKYLYVQEQSCLLTSEHMHIPS
ncbi:hypothetical protein BWQ96_07337 [Gracilariopsis chorda]|uniref:Uncharacterized protein n=1 Tax=Gracilariopsis chorda TaxID=448386 RepID=A0A2V3IP37_9FLOR|nr:hypothetical protein BWQ96_07337 [Gracilariopsis chorda]|eukprot:PXF42890.1 hypothetical protein BWQ96_07337 [Gracilariopsis chorda]